jgi:hypothetical protein
VCPFLTICSPPLLATEELLPAGVYPSIHSDIFARYERGVLEIEHRVDDIRNFTHPAEGMKLGDDSVTFRYPIGEVRKSGLLVVFVIGLSATCTTWANDSPSLGSSRGIPVKDLVAKVFRWVTITSPYGLTPGFSVAGFPPMWRIPL